MLRDLIDKLDKINEESDKEKNLRHRKDLDDLERSIRKSGSMDKETEAEINKRRRELMISKTESFQIGDQFGFSFSEDMEVGTTIVDLVEDGIVVELDDMGLSHLEENGCSFDEGEIVEAHGNDKIYDKCWKGYRKVPGKKRGEEGSCVKEGILDKMWDASKQAIRDPNVDWDKVERESDMVYDLQDAGYSDKQIKMAYGILNDPRYKQGNMSGALKTIEKIAPGMSEEPAIQNAIRATQEDTEVGEAEYQGRKVSLGKPTRGDVKKFKVYVKNPKGNVVKVNFGDPNMKIKKSNPARRKSFRARHNCDNPGPRHKARYWSCRKW